MKVLAFSIIVGVRSPISPKDFKWLDDDPQIKPSQSIFCVSRGDWHVDPGSLQQHDEMPPR
jgi:hypothetical protein